MNVNRIVQGDSDYPTVLQDRLGEDAPDCLYAIGKTTILRNRLLGMICSIQCPGSVILKTFDAVRALRDSGVVVIGGFLSPMEKECLDILLRGKQPAIFCAAKTLAGLRLTQRARQALKENRLLLLSPFADSIRRTTAAQAVLRNNLVAALADEMWVPHASPGGKTWQTVYSALERSQPVFTFKADDNTPLLDAGARPFELLRTIV